LQQLDFERIKAHISHHIIAITHGDPPVNARLECETCGTVLYSADPPRQAEPVRMHQFLLMNGPAVELQVLAPLHLRADLLNIAIVETAKVLAIPLAELASDQVASDQETVWAELCAAAREYQSYAVSLRQVTVLLIPDREEIWPVTAGGTRPVEVFRCWPEGEGDQGSWDTAIQDVPIDTPNEDIGEVAAAAHLIYLRLHNQHPVAVGFYNLPPIEDAQPGMDVDTFVTLAWLLSSLDREVVLEGGRAHLYDLQMQLYSGHEAGPLAPLQLAVNLEAERLTDDWSGLAMPDKLRGIGAFIINLAVRERMEQAEGLEDMTAEAIVAAVLTPVVASLESVARSRA
jgi:hypothetical protein